MSQPDRFKQLVLEWLREPTGGNVPDAFEVVYVRGDGTDWEGDTEGGFYSQFAVEIKYILTAGAGTTGVIRYKTVMGDEMQSLWDWVVVRGFQESA